MGADRYCEYERMTQRIGREARAAFGDQSPGDVKQQLAAAIARAEKAEALYAKAWEECGTWRYANGAKTEAGWTSTRYAGDGKYYADYPNHAADAHDAARREAGYES